MLAVALYVGYQCTYGQAGTLDPAFGTNGIVKTNIGSGSNYTSAGCTGLTQAVGSMSIITLASFGMEVTKKFADGSTDFGYGNNGFSQPIPIHGGFTPDIIPPHAVLQADGKLVVAGVISNSFAVARFNIDGTLDKPFATEGIALSSDGRMDVAASVAIAPNGKIIVAGYSYLQDIDGFYSRFALLQFNTDGKLENETFSDGGGYSSLRSKAMEKLLPRELVLLFSGTILMVAWIKLLVRMANNLLILDLLRVPIIQ